MNILITGTTGLVGSALKLRLQSQTKHILLTPTMEELNLLSQASIRQYFRDYGGIDFIFHCAAKVGGVLANKQYPAEFFYQNVLMNTLLVEEAKKDGIKNMIVLNSGCVYANDYSPPHEEWAILHGQPHKDHAPYAYAKRLLNVQSLAYEQQYGMRIIVAVLSNLYGPRDNFNLEQAHVLPSLLRKFLMAKQHHEQSVSVWGDGFPKRDFLFVEDLIDALLILADYCFEPAPIMKTNVFNIGCGYGITIKQLCQHISNAIDYHPEITWDYSKPNGQMEKYLDITRMKMLGWHPRTTLEDGISLTAQWLADNLDTTAVRL